MALKLAIALLLAPALLAEVAAAQTLSADYTVSIKGFPVGSAKFTAKIADGRYTIAFSGGIRGIARLFSDAETTANASGRVGSDRLQPERYSHVWTENHKVETVAMRFARRGVTAIALDPPRRHPERYVPLTPETNADALDLVSAFVWPIAAVDPELCARTLPLIDGKRRFDVTLAYARREPFATQDQSFRTNAVVCSFRYRDVAGQRIGKNDASITDSGDAEVWMAPVAQGLAMPLDIRFRTPAGRLVLKATTISAE
jgi:hypothetical protein